MRFKEFVEGIRMGSRDLSVSPSKQYTIGFEFEVVVNDEATVDKDDDDDYGDDYAYDDEEDDMDALWDEFSEYWYNGGSTFDFEDWINSNIIRSNRELLDLIKDNNIEPRNPASDEDVIRIRNEEKFSEINEFKQEIGEEEFNNIIKLIKEYENDIDRFLENPSNVLKLASYDYIFIRGYTDEENINSVKQSLKSVIDFLFDNNEYDKIEKYTQTHYERLKDKFVREETTVDDLDDSTIYFFDNDNNILELDDIRDMDDLTEYFDVDQVDLRDFTVEDWGDYESELMSDEFNDWYHSRSGSGSSSTKKIKYVSSVIKDKLGVSVSSISSKNSWAVIPDGTYGVDAEITSPALPLDQGIQTLTQVLKIIKDNPNLFTSRATGLHINIGTFNQEEIKQIDWLKFLMILNAERVLTYFDRVHNTFAPDQLPNIVKSLEQNDIKNYMKNIQKVSSLVRSASQKYSAVNLAKLNKYGAIELRAPGNKDYENKAEYLVDVVKRIIRALELSKDPEAYKKEYLSKLYSRYGKDSAPAVAEDPLDTYFSKTFGHRLSRSQSITEIVLIFIKLAKSKTANELNKHMNLKLYTQVVDLSSRIRNPKEVHDTILEYLSEHDQNNKIASSKFMKSVLNTLKKKI